MKLKIKIKIKKYFIFSVDSEQEVAEIQQEQPEEAMKMNSGNFKFWKVSKNSESEVEPGN